MRFLAIILLFILIAFSSCAILTKSESKEISNFAGAVNGFSGIPPKINDSYYQWKLQSQRMAIITGLDSNIQKDDFLAVDENYILRKKEYDSTAAKVDTFCSLIGKISKTISLLTDQSYLTDFSHKADTLSINLDSAISNFNKIENKKIPPVSGNTLGALYKDIIKYRIKKLQKKYLTRFLDSITPIVDTLVMLRESIFITSRDIEIEKETRRQVEENLVNSKIILRTSNNSKDVELLDLQTRVWFNSEVLSGLETYHNLKTLVPQNDKTLLKLKESMDKLDKDIHVRKISAKDLFAATKGFISDAENLSKSYDKFQTALKKNN